MTATDVSSVTPAEGAKDTKKASPTKEVSPVKAKTPEEIQQEANDLLAIGKRDLLVNNIPEAVSNLAKACELLSKQFGETAKECAEVYYYYGKSLLELSRMESGVLGNALDGVPEEESESNTSQFEDPSKLSDQEKTDVTEKIADALEQNIDELEKMKEKAEEAKKDSTSKAAETKEGTDAAKKAESTDDSKKSETKDDVEAKKPEAEAKDESKEDKKGEKEKAEESKKGDSQDEAMEEDEDVETGDETGDEAAESSDEKKEEGANEKKDEEEPSNLQLAWEMLELAKIVYTKLVTDAKDDDKLALLEKLCCALCALGEVSIESENYKQAIEDFQACLKKQAEFPKDSRCRAETHYQLGVALGYDAQFDEAVTSLKCAISIIQERITLQEKEESEEAKKEVTELKTLVPEIEEKIKDTEDMKKEENKKTTEAAASSSGDTFGPDKTAEVKPVSSIAVKRKAEEEDSSSKKLAAEKETAAAS